jgi:glycosyltransferase involved in cell wall biosynthesis
MVDGVLGSPVCAHAVGFVILMPTIAYLSNRYPSPVEPYVVDEIHELRKQWVHVIPCSARSVRSADLSSDLKPLAAETLYLQPLRWALLARSAWYFLRHFRQFADLFERVVVQGTESPLRRARCFLHTWLGVYYALMLDGRGVDHIHVHHGYFSSWVAMVAARVLGIEFSMTLHGSDLLVNRAYLDTKLKHCRFCLTVSGFNRDYIFEHYPSIDPCKVLVQRIGVAPPLLPGVRDEEASKKYPLLLSVGRLHRVKDHAFLIEACKKLKDGGLRTLCLIAGEGPERKKLERMIRKLDLTEEVGLLGHVAHDQIQSHYAMADVVVLTSRSEGVPLVLMEAMAMGKIVLAPDITGIPELVVHGTTGFLYRQGSIEDFTRKLRMIWDLRQALEPVRKAARKHVRQHFDREANLAAFADVFLNRVAGETETEVHEDSVLQQV